MLRAQNVSCCYTKKPVLADLSFGLSLGQVVGVIGANGAGKSTLLKTIAGLIQPGNGTIHWFDKPHTHQKTKQQIAYLPEKFFPPGHLSGVEYLRFMASFYANPSLGKTATAMLDTMNLKKQDMLKPLCKLSKGSLQKIGFVTTLLSGKMLLLLDEAMDGLDPQTRIHAREYLKAQKNNGQLILLSTHRFSDLEKVCDCILIMGKGKLIFNGSLADCLASIKNKLAFSHNQNAVAHLFQIRESMCAE